MKRFHAAIALVVMWQAAVPNTVFSNKPCPGDLYHYWDLPNISSPVEKFLVLFSENDNILGPRHFDSKRQEMVDIEKDPIERAIGKSLELLHLHSIYALASLIGVPITHFKDPVFRERVYHDWISAYPLDKSNRPFDERLATQASFYYQSGKRGMLLSVTATLMNTLFMPYQNQDESRNWILLERELASCVPHDELPTFIGIVTLAHVMTETEVCIPHALGHQGPDWKSSHAQSLSLAGQLQAVDQKEVLMSHGGMKSPSAKLFQSVYVDVILRCPQFRFGKD